MTKSRSCSTSYWCSKIATPSAWRTIAELDGHLGMVDQILDTLVHHQSAPARPGSARDPEGQLDDGHSH